MSYVKEKTVAYAESQIGFHEIPDGSNCNPYSDWQYGVRCPGGGWCISFTSKCAVEGGYQFDGATHGSKGFSYTESAESWARAHGLWRDKWWHSQPGDWWIFNWDGGATDHGELVKKDDGQWAVLVGGNTSNAVKYRTRDRRYLVGIVALSQSSQAHAAPPPPPPFKVRPMYDPAVKLRAVLAANGGMLLGFEGGRVDWFPPDYPTSKRITGGMITDADRKAFQGRTLARLVARPYMKDGVQKHGYTIVATSGEKYVPQAQH